MKTVKYNPSEIDPRWPRTSLTSPRGLHPRSRGAAIRGKQSYNPSLIENKWQAWWERTGVYQPDMVNAKKPFYNLMMFPYPSAEGLHVGNVYAFTGADINGRFMRMKGYDVFEPIGLDGFGIHSENYAIKIGKHPANQAKISEKNFYRQLHAIGNGFAWKSALETYDPDYYKWTQWIFTQMFKAGLAYRKKSPVNFCPSCKTVLSDEQVIDGRCERCKTLVEKRDMEQWFFKITNYAERLLQNTYKKSFQWTEKVKIGQRNWIGKKEGINITYQVVDSSGTPSTISHQPPTITVFTTRPDTNFGATFIVLGPEHPFVDLLLKTESHKDTWKVASKQGLLPGGGISKAIREYVERAKKKSEAERIAEGRKKTGVFTGFYAVNQLTNYKMPIWISDFVLGNVGTGAVVGVPGHDMRDFEFAREFGLEIKVVVIPEKQKAVKTPRGWQVESHDSPGVEELETAYEGEGTIINSSFLNGLTTKEAIKRISDYLEKKGWGKRTVTYHLRDWLISRQRYWGAPIPMIFCSSCAKSGQDTSGVARRDSPDGGEKKDDSMPGWFPVPEDQLPVLLPENVKDWKPEGTGKGPLAKIPSFVNVKCPRCGGSAKRETDVCDTFLDSSWYHMRYPSVNKKQKTRNKKQESDKDTSEVARRDSPDGGGIGKELPWDPEITRKWLPVTQYIGGAEHTVLHLLYARFVWMCFYDWGCFNFSAKGGPASGWEEPYTRFYAHGLIIAEGAKMSKSRGNVVIPDAYITKYGADTLRTYLMFLGPFDHGGDFRDTGIAGMYRFLSRVWRLVLGSLSPKLPKSLRSLKGNNDLEKFMHRAVKEVTQDMENLRYNTAIAHIMEYVNFLTDSRKNDPGSSSRGNDPGSSAKEAIKTLLLLLAPFAPHMTEELWQNFFVSPLKSPKQLKSLISIHKTAWPSFDPKYLVEDEVTIIVQVNGKVRDTIKIGAKDTSDGGEATTSTPPRWRDQKEVEKIALASPKIQKYISVPSHPSSPSNSSNPPKKIIFIPGKLINFVV